jgi:hypothetical protein
MLFSGFEIVRLVEIGKQPGLGCHYLFGGLADDRDVQASGDHASDVPERHALLGDAMIPGAQGQEEGAHANRLELVAD